MSGGLDDSRSSLPPLEIQNSELEVLSSIFGDAFELLPKKKANRFKLTLVPHPGAPEENHSIVSFQVTLPLEYPKEPPTIEINKEAGLSEAEVADLRSEVSKKVRELLGREMIYELTQFAEEWLQRHNHKPQSFYDEMIARQQEKERQEQELELAQLQRAREEKEALQQMIKAELRRKEEMLKKSTETTDHISSSGDWPGELHSSESSSSSGRPSVPEPRMLARARRGTPHQIEEESEEDEDNFDDEDDLQDDDDDEDDLSATTHRKTSTAKRGAQDRMQKQQQKGRSPKVGVRNLEEILAEAKKAPTAASPPTVPKTAAEKPNPVPPATATGPNSPQKANQVQQTTAAPAGGSAKQRQPFSWLASRTIAEDKHAKVSKGFNFSLGQSIIIKQYTLYDVPPEMRQERYDLVERIEGEVKRAAHQLPKHDHIIHYIDSSFSDNSLCIFTEFVAGGSLQSVLKEANRLEESVIKRYTKQVLQAISVLHSKGFSNLNVKVSNMLLDSQGNVKICDYVATQELSDLITNVFRTNMDYFLLQDERNKEAQHRKMDIQCLGWAIIEMATGSKDQRSLPDTFSKEAKTFVDFCIKGKAESVLEVMRMSFVGEEDSTLTHEGAFIPMSPPSSSAGGTGTHDYHQSVFMMSRAVAQQQAQMSQMTFGPGGMSSMSAMSSFHTGSDSDMTTMGGMSMSSSTTFDNVGNIRRSQQQSRYRGDFEELEVLGKGGFGQVVKARNRLDGRVYAIKKIRFARMDSPFVQKMLREVTTLSRLHHQNVVRYYHSWIDDADAEDQRAIAGAADDDISGLIDSKVDLSDIDGETTTVGGEDEDDTEADWFGQASLSSRPVTRGAFGVLASSDDEEDDEDDESNDEDESHVGSPALTALATGAESSDADEADDAAGYSEDDSWGESAVASDAADALFGDDESLGFNPTRDLDPLKRAKEQMERKKAKEAKRMAAKKEDPNDKKRAKGKGGKKKSAASKKKGVQGPSKILYIQMEYCTERTLRNVIDEKPDDETMWKLFRQIVEGLNHIHSQGIIHRDLKPSNIFIDAQGDAKIGDFGLAVTSAVNRTTTAAPTVQVMSLKESLTIGVGTPFYLAPEQEKIGSHYDHKVDMYSLGVIFFEMFNRFGTGMERVEVLKRVRDNPPKLPESFEKQDPRKAEIVRWLLDHDSSKRPTTSELLQSDLLPARLEEEILKEALRTITTPNTTMYNIMLKRLFSIQPDDHVQFTYDYGVDATSAASSIIRAEVGKRMTKVFKKHGALHFDTPLYLPKPRLFDQNNSVDVLDPAGTLLQTAYDLTMPFARWVAHAAVNNMRRYHFGKVYRKNLAGGQPRELHECDFDIVSPSSYKWINIAEVIKTCAEALNEFGSELGALTIRLNHYRILDSILQSISGSEEIQSKIRRALSQFWKKSWTEIRKELIQIEGLPVKIVDGVLREIVTLSSGREGPLKMKEALTRLSHMFPSNKVMLETIKELKHLNHYAKVFGIVDMLLFDITLVYNYDYYYGDIVFQISVNRTDIVAAGGCYDSLVDYFANPVAPRLRRGVLPRERRGPSGASARTASGVNIALDRIVALVGQSRASAALTAKNRNGVRKSLTHVFVYSQGANLIDERLETSIRLWSAGIHAEYAYEDGMTLDDLLIRCKSSGIPYIVIIRDKTFQATQTLKIKNVETKAEEVVSLNDLTSVLTQTLRLNKHGTSGAPGTSSNAALASASAGGRRAANVSTTSTDTSKASTQAPSNASLDQDASNSRGAERDRGNAASSFHQSHGVHNFDASSVLDVDILGSKADRSQDSKTRRKLAYNAQSKVAPFVRFFHTQQSIKVGALDMSLTIMKEVADAFLNSASDLSALLTRFPRHREKIYLLRDFLTQQKSKGVAMVFLYSTNDDDYALIPFRK